MEGFNWKENFIKRFLLADRNFYISDIGGGAQTEKTQAKCVFRVLDTLYEANILSSPIMR
jgi:hypothetical protein